MSLLVSLPPAGDAPWEPVAADKRLSGTPQTRTWVHYEDVTRSLSAGEWEATPGKWRIAYTEWEYVHVLTGRCTLTGDDGTTLTAGPGEAFVIEPGFSGTWEVLEPMRKRWVIREP
jgi:uncharacterized cupin superfamily protein